MPLATLIAALIFALAIGGTRSYAQGGAVAPTKKDLPAIELESEDAKVLSVNFYLDDIGPTLNEKNPFGKDPFKLPTKLLLPALVEVTATVKKTPGIGPMQVAFPVPNPDRADEVRTLLDELAKTYEGWPRDAVVTIDVDFGRKGTTDDPSMFAVAVLLHSLIQGKDIASNLVVSGDLGAGLSVVPPAVNKDGAVSNGEIIEAVVEDPSNPIRFIRAPVSYHALNDLAIDGDWETLTSLTLITVPTLAEALRIAFITNVSDLGEALSGFESAQEKIRKGTPASMAKGKQVQDLVIAAGKALRTNQSAVFYALFARGRVPRTYSPEYSYKALKGYHDQIRVLLTEMPADARDQFKELITEQKEIRSKLNRDLAPILRALDDFQKTVSSAMSKPGEGSALDRQKEDIKKADEKAVALLDAFAKKIRAGGKE